MGCHYSTCCISHLPIYRGEKVVLVIGSYPAPIGENQKNLKSLYACNSNAYAYKCTDLFRPISLPVRGEYNEYGAIEKVVADEITKKLLLQEYRYITEDGNTVTFKDVEQLIKAIEESNILIDAPRGAECLTFCMYHEEVYDKLVDDIKNRKAEFSDKPMTFFEKLVFSEGFKPFFVGDGEAKQIVLNNFNRLFSNYLDNYEYIFNKHIESMYNNGLLDIFNRNFVSFVCFMIALNHLRMTFSGRAAGLGSQCQEMKLHGIVADFVLKHIDAYKNRLTKEEELTAEELESSIEEPMDTYEINIDGVVDEFKLISKFRAYKDRNRNT